MKKLFKEIYIIWLREMIRYWRTKPRLISSLAMPLIWLVLFGSGMKSAFAIGGGQAGFDFIQFLFPGVIGMSILFTSIFSVMSIVTDRQFGFLKEILVAPVSRVSIALGKILGGSTTAMIQGTIMILLSPIVGIKLSLGLVLAMLPVMFIASIALTSIGLVVASRMKSAEGFQMIMNFIMMPMFFLSGAMFPLSNLPNWMDILSKINPASYAIDLVRQVSFKFMDTPTQVIDLLSIDLFGHQVNLWTDLLIVSVFGVIMVTFGVFLFNKSD
ncbi:ABC transporter permease [Patescibacteria group bacterium]|nr:ABC transporter permease [Patescibacteria group bacterium]MBU1890433.1 ABC transporter permease [Patescibacteria group bacterium]